MVLATFILFYFCNEIKWNKSLKKHLIYFMSDARTALRKFSLTYIAKYSRPICSAMSTVHINCSPLYFYWETIAWKFSDQGRYFQGGHGQWPPRLFPGWAVAAVPWSPVPAPLLSTAQCRACQLSTAGTCWRFLWYHLWWNTWGEMTSQNLCGYNIA